jgi:hypothetical protein
VASKRSTPSWSDLKVKLADLDRAELVGLVQALYAANRDNQAFLHARFALGDDVLKPYKATIDRWLWPDYRKKQDTSVAKAKKAITDYRRAVGQAEGLAELMVFYCERATGFAKEVGLQEEGYADALVRMFAQAIKAVEGLPQPHSELWDRLDAVSRSSRDLAFDLGTELGLLMAESAKR